MNLPDRIRALFAPKEPEHPGECASLLRLVSGAGGIMADVDVEALSEPHVIRLACSKGLLRDCGAWNPAYELTKKGERALARWPAHL